MSGAIVVHQNRLLRRFQDAQATNPKSARPLADIGCRDSRIFRRMVAQGVFIETGGGRYYMDENAARALVHLRRRKMLAFLVFAFILVMVWLLFSWLFF